MSKVLVLFVPSIAFVDPHACLVTFHIVFSCATSSWSCSYILPRFPHLKQVISHTGVDMRRADIFQIWCFCKSIFLQVVFLCCALILDGLACFVIQNHPPHLSAAFWWSLHCPRTILLHLQASQVIIFIPFSFDHFNIVVFGYLFSYRLVFFTITFLNPSRHMPSAFPCSTSLSR